MYCPRCGGEFREGVARCSDCGVDLVPGELTRSNDFRLEEPPADPVIVFTAGDATLLAVARSLLESERIPHFVRGEGLQDLIGLGRFGSGFNPLLGPGEIEVPASEAARARDLLRDLDAPEEEEDTSRDAEGDEVGDEVGDDPYALPGRPTELREAGTGDAPGLPTPGDRRRFRILVLAYLASVVAAWLYSPRWIEEIPDGLFAELDSHFGTTDLSRTVDNFLWLELPAAIVIGIGLLTFSRQARNLFVAFWMAVVALQLLGSPGVAGGLVSTFAFLVSFLGGAVLALAFFGPIAAAFEAAPSVHRRTAEPPPPPPEALATSPE